MAILDVISFISSPSTAAPLFINPCSSWKLPSNPHLYSFANQLACLAALQQIEGHKDVPLLKKRLATQRKVTAARQAFLQLLASYENRIQIHSTWASVRPFLFHDTRFGTGQLEEEERRDLFKQYVSELRTAEQLRLQRGEETFKARLTFCIGQGGACLYSWHLMRGQKLVT